MDSVEDKKPPTAHVYAFPVAEATSPAMQVRLAAATHNELLAGLERVSALAKTYSGQARTLFCALNLELNRRRNLAPRFREMRRPDQASSLPADQQDLSNDRQVIDLHWLHCREINCQNAKGEYKRLLVANDFDFDTAGSLAKEECTADVKARWLRLPENVAWELASIQTKNMRDRFGVLMHGKRKNGKQDMHGLGEIVATLATAAAKRKGNEVLVDGWAKLWLVDRMLGPNGTPTLIAQLFAFATGAEKMPDSSQIMRKLATVQSKIKATRQEMKWVA